VNCRSQQVQLFWDGGCTPDPQSSLFAGHAWCCCWPCMLIYWHCMLLSLGFFLRAHGVVAGMHRWWKEQWINLFSAPAESAGKIGVDSFKILPSKLSQTVGGGHFFVCHNIWEVAKIKICQTNYPKLLELLLVASTTLLGCYDGVTLFYRLIKYRVFVSSTSSKACLVTLNSSN
jgi:hypothetical protein